MAKEININTYKYEFIVDRLEMDFSDEELMHIWNEIDSTRDCSKPIYQMKELNYVLRNNTPTDIVILTHHDKFDSNHNFIYFATDGRLCTALILDYIPFFKHDEIAKYLINTNSKKLQVYENELRDYFLSELFLSDKDDAKKVLDNLMAFGMADIIGGDWNKIYGLIQKLIH